MEILIKQQEIQPIDFNFEEIKQSLESKLSSYKGMIYTDENIKLAKDDRADLNKLKKALNDRRIAEEKKYIILFNTFKDKMNVLIKMIDDTNSEIDVQVKKTEENNREDKRKAIIEMLGETAKTYEFSLIPILAQMSEIDPKWLNLGTSLKDIDSAIRVRFDTIKTELEIINSLETDFKDQLIDKYIQTRNIASVMAEKVRLEKQRELIELAKKPVEKPIEKPEPKAEPIPEPKAAEPEFEEIINQTIQFWATEKQYDAMRVFFNENKIKHGRANP